MTRRNAARLFNSSSIGQQQHTVLQPLGSLVKPIEYSRSFRGGGGANKKRKEPVGETAFHRESINHIQLQCEYY